MSAREVDRLGVARKVVAKRLLQREAALQLGLSVRQVQRLVRRYRADGPAGLVSRRRGRVPNNVIGAEVRREVMDWVRKRYSDFGPTLACEKLTEVHGYRLSAETLRQWMMAEGRHPVFRCTSFTRWSGPCCRRPKQDRSSSARLRFVSAGLHYSQSFRLDRRVRHWFRAFIPPRGESRRGRNGCPFRGVDSGDYSAMGPKSRNYRASIRP